MPPLRDEVFCIFVIHDAATHTHTRYTKFSQNLVCVFVKWVCLSFSLTLSWAFTSIICNKKSWFPAEKTRYGMWSKNLISRNLMQPADINLHATGKNIAAITYHFSCSIFNSCVQILSSQYYILTLTFIHTKYFSEIFSFIRSTLNSNTHSTRSHFHYLFK